MGPQNTEGRNQDDVAMLDSAVFPGVQGGPLEHVIAAKAVSFFEALTDLLHGIYHPGEEKCSRHGKGLC